MKTFLKSLDYFSKEFNFTYKGKDRYNTILGGLITIVSLLIIIFNAWLIGKDIYLRENPVVLGYEQALRFFPTTKINYNDMFFSFFISDTLNNPFEDDTILKIIPLMYTNYYDKNGNLKYRERFLEYTDCNSEFQRLNITPPLSPSIFLPLKCIKNFNEYLSGFWTDTHISYLMFKAYSCTNITIEENTNIKSNEEEIEFEEFEKNMKNLNVIKMNVEPSNDSNINGNSITSLNANTNLNTVQVLEKNNTDKINFSKNKTFCKSSHEIKKIIPTLFFNFFFSGIVVNSKNYTNPMIVQINEDWFNLGTSIFKTIDYYFQNYFVRTDDGLIFSQDYKDINKMGYYKHLADYRSLEEGDNNIFWLNIYISNQVKYYTREYLKVQNIFANLGGIIQVVLISFKIFFAPYFNKKLNLKIINEIFDFEEISDKNILDWKILKKNNVRRIDSLLNLKNNKKPTNNAIILPYSKFIDKDKEKKGIITENGLIEESQNVNYWGNNKFECHGEKNENIRKLDKMPKKKIENKKEFEYNDASINNLKHNKNEFLIKEDFSKNFYDLSNYPLKYRSFLEEKIIKSEHSKDYSPFKKNNNDSFQKSYHDTKLTKNNIELINIKSMGNNKNSSNKINLNNRSINNNIVIIKNEMIGNNNIIQVKEDFKNNSYNKINLNKKHLKEVLIEFKGIINEKDKIKENPETRNFTPENLDKFLDFYNSHSKKKERSKNIREKISNSNQNLIKNPAIDDFSNVDIHNKLNVLKKKSQSLEKEIGSFKKSKKNVILEKKIELSPKNEITSFNENVDFYNPSQQNLGQENKRPTIIDRTIQERMEEVINFKERKLKFKNLEIFNSFYFYFCCTRKKKLQEKNKLYNFAQENLSNYTDYLVLIKNFQDLTKMKYILFNTNQIYSFPFLSNPKKQETGVHHEIQEYARAFDSKLTKNQLAMEIFHYFKKKIREDKLDGFDKKIWNIFDPKMKNMFITTSNENNFN